MQQQGIVKSIFIRGSTDERGFLPVQIEAEDAELTVGRWRTCLNNLIVSLVESQEGSIPVTVSATHSYYHCYQKGVQHKVNLPAKQAQFVIYENIVPGLPFVALEKNNQWVEVLQPSNKFSLVFENTVSKKAKPLRLKVQAILLFERLA